VLKGVAGESGISLTEGVINICFGFAYGTPFYGEAIILYFSADFLAFSIYDFTFSALGSGIGSIFKTLFISSTFN